MFFSTLHNRPLKMPVVDPNHVDADSDPTSHFCCRSGSFPMFNTYWKSKIRFWLLFTAVPVFGSTWSLFCIKRGFVSRIGERGTNGSIVHNKYNWKQDMIWLFAPPPSSQPDKSRQMALYLPFTLSTPFPGSPSHMHLIQRPDTGSRCANISRCTSIFMDANILSGATDFGSAMFLASATGFGSAMFLPSAMFFLYNLRHLYFCIFFCILIKYAPIIWLAQIFKLLG